MVRTLKEPGRANKFCDGIVPRVFDAITDYRYTVQYETDGYKYNVPLTVPMSFVQGLKTSTRKKAHLKNMYTRMHITMVHKLNTRGFPGYPENLGFLGSKPEPK
jgi:hypothetical protein